MDCFIVPVAVTYAGVECCPQWWYVAAAEDLCGSRKVVPEQHVLPRGHGREENIIVLDH